MKALDRKLLRELAQSKAQVATIALVVASGVATYVASISTFDSLQTARLIDYERARFPDLFARAVRVPNHVARELAAIPGIAELEDRLVAEVTLDLAAVPEPTRGRIISIPVHGESRLSRVLLRRGRNVEPGRAYEVLALETFVVANRLSLGDRVTGTIEGRRIELKIAGVVSTPEYASATLSGEPWIDERRAGVFWMDRAVLGQLTNMSGAFNQVLARLSPGASPARAIAALDRLLEPYGATGAHGRDKHASDRFITNELSQLEVQATSVPLIFLLVAAFLLNVVLSRTIDAQRQQIASLEALGYSRARIALHFAELALVIVIAGAVLGTLAGAYLGSGMLSLYSQYFHFTEMEYRLSPALIAQAMAIGGLAALWATIGSVRRVLAVAPAEGMRPAPPAKYRGILAHPTRVATVLSATGRLMIRNLEGRPWRTLSSIVGIALAVMVMVVGRFSADSVDYLIDTQFRRAHRDDVTVMFAGATHESARHELGHLTGVRAVEPMRNVPARFIRGARRRDAVLVGLEPNARLRQIIAADGSIAAIPREGVLISQNLADVLEARPGTRITVELLERCRSRHEVIVTGVIDEMLGMSGYMSLDALARLIRDGPVIDGALLAVGEAEQPALLDQLAARPRVGAAARRSAIVTRFEESSAGMLLLFTLILTAFASAIAVGVVYNAARVSLAEQSRDLATLRVLGFTRGEITSILFGQLAIQTALAIPLGLMISRWAAFALFEAMIDPELFRLTPIIYPSTYAFGVAVVLAAGTVSALFVRRHLHHLDLIGVLKAQD